MMIVKYVIHNFSKFILLSVVELTCFFCQIIIFSSWDKCFTTINTK